jgi:kynureninase
MGDYAHTWATRGVRAWAERWWTMSREVGDAIAAFIGAPTGSVGMCESVTSAHMSILSTLPPPSQSGRDAIVCSAADFPSLIYLFRAHEALGFRLVVVAANDNGTSDPERIADAIDDRTALVAISHVLFRSSFIVDPAAVVERARRAGAVVALDLYQAAGIIPVDVTALGVDFAAGGCLKWLCGGPGNAFLYARPDRAVRPRFTGWASHPTPFAFDIDVFDAPPDARRLQTGTPAIPAYYAALPGLRLLHHVGVHAIRSASMALTRRVLDLVDEYGFHTVAVRDPSRLAGAVSVAVPDPLAVARTLNASDIVVDYRPEVGIRIAPHVYNTVGEVETAMSALAEIVRTRRYAPPTDSVVT